jgi:hypothetical protein
MSKRLCPECNKELVYKSTKSLKMAIKAESLCKSCSKKGDKAPSWNGASLLVGREAYYHARNKGLKCSYGITLDDYNKMFIEQNGCCKICNKHQSELKQILAVDHCHITNKVRGLLCGNCNRGLGLFKDNTLILNEAIKYINKNK